jgi:hypothetical protein
VGLVALVGASVTGPPVLAGLLVASAARATICVVCLVVRTRPALVTALALPTGGLVGSVALPGLVGLMGRVSQVPLVPARLLLDRAGWAVRARLAPALRPLGLPGLLGWVGVPLVPTAAVLRAVRLVGLGCLVGPAGRGPQVRAGLLVAPAGLGPLGLVCRVPGARLVMGAALALGQLGLVVLVGLVGRVALVGLAAAAAAPALPLQRLVGLVAPVGPVGLVGVAAAVTRLTSFGGRWVGWRCWGWWLSGSGGSRFTTGRSC